MKFIPLGLALLISSSALGAASVTEVPAKPDPGKDYVFYLHGRLVETSGQRPTHPEFGLYDHPAIELELGADGAVVITEQRPAGTRVEAYARRVLAQIEQLVERGVPPSRIAVVGFSKGAAIALRISSLSERPEIRFVLLAICGEWLAERPALRLTGSVLSIHEASDEIGGSCRSLAERSPGPESFTEIEISTGQRHGAFYLPRNEWLIPLREWLQNGKSD